MGKLRILQDGIRVDGQAEFMSSLYAKTVESRKVRSFLPFFFIGHLLLLKLTLSSFAVILKTPASTTTTITLSRPVNPLPSNPPPPKLQFTSLLALRPFHKLQTYYNPNPYGSKVTAENSLTANYSANFRFITTQVFRF